MDILALLFHWFLRQRLTWLFIFTFTMTSKFVLVAQQLPPPEDYSHFCPRPIPPSLSLSLCRCAVTISQTQSQGTGCSCCRSSWKPSKRFAAHFCSLHNIFQFFCVASLGLKFLAAFDGEVDSNPPTRPPAADADADPGMCNTAAHQTHQISQSITFGENSLQSPCFSALSIHREVTFFHCLDELGNYKFLSDD